MSRSADLLLMLEALTVYTADAVLAYQQQEKQLKRCLNDHYVDAWREVECAIEETAYDECVYAEYAATMDSIRSLRAAMLAAGYWRV